MLLFAYSQVHLSVAQNEQNEQNEHKTNQFLLSGSNFKTSNTTRLNTDFLPAEDQVPDKEHLEPEQKLTNATDTTGPKNTFFFCVKRCTEQCRSRN